MPSLCGVTASVTTSAASASVTVVLAAVVVAGDASLLQDAIKPKTNTADRMAVPFLKKDKLFAVFIIVVFNLFVLCMVM